MSQLTTNTTTIDELITMASSLPDVGSGGEDISAEITEYTVQLDELESKINALPDAGSGSSGNIDTCSLTATAEYGNFNLFVATVNNNGKIETTWSILDGKTSLVLNNVICGTVVILTSNYNYAGWTVTGGTRIAYTSSGNLIHPINCAIQMPMEAGANVSVVCFDND